MTKVGPKESALQQLRDRQKRPQQRVKRVVAVKSAPKAAETSDEAKKAIRYYRKRLKTGREYQRGYYARNKAKIAAQRKARAERAGV